MKKLTLALLGLMLTLPANAQERPAAEEQVRNLVHILFPEAGFIDQKNRLKAQFDMLFDDRFGCVKQGSELQNGIHAKFDGVFTYDAMVDRIVPLLGELSSDDILKVMEFYKSETGAKWARINEQMPEEASKAGTELGKNFMAQAMPLLLQDKECSAKLHKESLKQALPQKEKQ